MKRPTHPVTPSQEFSIRRLVVICAVSGFLGGVVALAMVAVMVWLSNLSWVVDDPEGHGISEQESSRLGGVAVFLGALAFYAGMAPATGGSVVSPPSFIALLEQRPSSISYVLLIALIGLWDDFVTRFRPIARLLLVFAISMAAFLTDAVPMPQEVYGWLPFGLNNSLTLSLAGALIVTGFVNAGNMADGANGLLVTIGLSFLAILMLYGSGGFAPLLTMALLIFFVFNVGTGRIFLGDFGAYGLSALMAFCSLELYAGGAVSMWFLASLLAYPCIELIRVITVRILQGRSPFKSSNDHLHNYLYEFLRLRGWDHLVANSSTGCFLGFASCFVPALFGLLGLVDIGRANFWIMYFGLYSLLHLIFVVHLRRLIRFKNADRPDAGCQHFE